MYKIRMQKCSIILLLLFTLLPYQACQKPTPPSTEISSKGEMNGNGEPYGGMRSLFYAKNIAYHPDQITPDAESSFYRYRHGSFCETSEVERFLSHAGLLFYDGLNWLWQKDECSTLNLTQDEVTYYPFNRNYVVKGHEIYERLSAPLNLAHQYSQSFLFCSEMNEMGEGASLVVKKNERYPETPVDKAKDINFYLETLKDGVEFQRDDRGVSIASYFDENGLLRISSPGEPRFEYHPKTGEYLGLLIEGSSTNWIAFSEEFGEGWLGHTVQGNLGVAPDGLNSADLLSIPASNQASLSQSLPGLVQSSGYWTTSLFIKQLDGAQKLEVALKARWSGTGEDILGSALFNLDDLTTTLSGDANSAAIQELRNGWYRISLTHFHSSNKNPDLHISLSATNLSAQSSGLYIWGAQVEAQPFATSYIATSGSPVKRQPDAMNLSTGGWLNPHEGTFLVEWRLAGVYPQEDQHIFVTDSNGLKVEKASTGNDFHVAIREKHVIPRRAVEANRFYRSALSYQSGGRLVAYQDGGAPVSVSLGEIPDLGTQLYLGRDKWNRGYLFGHLRRISYWSFELKESQLIDATRPQTYLSPYSATLYIGQQDASSRFVSNESTIFSLLRRNIPGETHFGSETYRFEIKVKQSSTLEDVPVMAEVDTLVNGEKMHFSLRCSVDD